MKKTILLAALLTSLAGGAALAHNHDRDLAVKMQALGAVKPLQDVLQQVQQQYPGRVLKIEFEEDDDYCKPARNCARLWVYEFKILQPAGELVKVYIDAHSGDTLQVRRRERGHD